MPNNRVKQLRVCFGLIAIAATLFSIFCTVDYYDVNRARIDTVYTDHRDGGTGPLDPTKFVDDDEITFEVKYYVKEVNDPYYDDELWEIMVFLVPEDLSDTIRLCRYETEDPNPNKNELSVTLSRRNGLCGIVGNFNFFSAIRHYGVVLSGPGGKVLKEFPNREFKGLLTTSPVYFITPECA